MLRWIFYFYPPFLLAKGFSDIAKKSGYAYDGKEFRWKLGPGYKYDDLWKENSGENLAKLTYSSPSTGFIMGLMLLNFVVYGFLTWYFDHIMSSNRGQDENWLFFLKSSYWCPGRTTGDFSIRQTKHLVPRKAADTDKTSAKHEYERVKYNIDNELPSNGLRVFNVSKFFKTTTTPKIDVKDDGPYSRHGFFRALSKVTFEVE